MNEDFNLDGNHEVDDLFRDALGNYSESPSDAAWGRLNKKLNYKEFHDFVSFKKAPVKNSSWPTPLCRMQWFRGAVVGSVAAALVASSVLLITSLNQEPTSLPQNLADSNRIPETPKNLQQPSSNPIPNTVTATDAPSLLNNSSLPEKVSPYVNPSVNPMNAHAPDQMGILPDTRIPEILNNQLNLTNNNLPLQIQQGSSDALQTEVARYHAASQVDSLIQAAIIKDSLEQISEDNNPAITEDDERDVNVYNPSQPVVTDNETAPLVANGFTPNGDGLNEYFYIHNLEKYPDNVLLIQDRKGGVVLDKKNYTGDWNAAGVPDGTYFYLFTYKDEQGHELSIQGVVYIIR